MGKKSETVTCLPDSAAVFASALSLWQECHKHAASEQRLNLSECYNGLDQFMREVMRAATLFEEWAFAHVVFQELNDVWPYLLEDRFGKACLSTISTTALAEFDDTDCLRIALRLRLPITLDDQLPLPVDVKAPNPIMSSDFREFRIQTIRNSIEGDAAAPFTLDDDPFDEEFSAPYFGLYGVSSDGSLEHIADRSTYSEAVALARKLAPTIQFPQAPTSESYRA